MEAIRTRNRPTPLSRWSGRLLPALLLAALGAFIGCANDPTARLLAAVPDLEPAFANHLVRDSDSTLAAHCRSTGWPRVHAAGHALARRDLRSMQTFTRTEEVVAPYLRKFLRAMAAAFDLDRQRQARLAYVDAPLETRYRISRHLDRIRAVASDTRTTARDRGERLLRLLEESNDPSGACRITALSLLGQVHIESGDRDSALLYHRSTLEAARAYGAQYMVCQTLGSLGELLRQKGDVDSMAIFWQQGIDCALEHRMSDQAARLYAFFANHYAEVGRWAVAGRYFSEARRVALDLGGDADGLGVLVQGLDLAVRLECWDLLGRELRSAGTELRRARALRSPWAAALTPRLLELQGLDRAHQGELTAAVRLFQSADSAYARGGPRMPNRGRVHHRWSRALLEGGRADDAAQVARHGLKYCAAAAIPEHIPALELVLARSLFATGDLEGSRSALERFRAAAGTGPAHIRIGEWIEHDALTVRLHVARGEGDSTVAALRAGLARLETGLAAMDAGPECYLFLLRQNELRDVLHALLAGNPEAGLLVELNWRRATSLIRSDVPTGDLVACAEIVADQLRDQGRLALANARPPGPRAVPPERVLRIVYYVGDRVVRWVESGGGVRRDVLATTPLLLRDAVSHAVARMASDPGGPDVSIDAALAADLSSLGEMLLPPELLQSGAQPGRIEVWAHGILDRLPFEALSSSRSLYRPLLMDHDVVYVRGLAPRPSRSVSLRGIALSNPRLSEPLRRAHGGIPELDQDLSEVRALAAADPSFIQLSGRHATKRALLARWEDSGVLFLAAHVTRDPERPYSSFIPLAWDSTARDPDSEYLEIADVLDADLSACRLVVLSGCASGVSNSIAGADGVSLGGAFLDAGAASAIQTLWPIRDDYAGALMGDFVRLWKGNRLAPEEALQRVRRARVQAKDGIRHPNSWAGYVIEFAAAPGEAGRRYSATAP